MISISKMSMDIQSSRPISKYYTILCYSYRYFYEYDYSSCNMLPTHGKYNNITLHSIDMYVL